MVAKSKRRSVIDHANYYGNIDVREGLPKGYCHIRQKEGIKLTHWAEKLNIEYVPAMDGFIRSGRICRPDLNGIVIASRSKQRLIRAIEARKRQKAEAARQKELLNERKINSCLDELTSLFPQIDRETFKQAVYQIDYRKGLTSRQLEFMQEKVTEWEAFKNHALELLKQLANKRNEKADKTWHVEFTQRQGKNLLVLFHNESNPDIDASDFFPVITDDCCCWDVRFDVASCVPYGSKRYRKKHCRIELNTTIDELANFYNS
ncbi:hypothetical protein F1728_15100 [Gimesia benthica]|uniref:Rad4 beta-hairpin domain-containing protein n=1 Tax=Gimesia benthica TaxID=2608982 RepID=A0A6I6AD34_9PLAN|nr:hypothetical protein [Gimesia benthica]QGQ23926.1 hypothetical protein F1728_15100 [Gimesia benthica]